MRERYWNERDNQFKEDSRDESNVLFAVDTDFVSPGKHLIQRRTGPKVYKRYRCIRCGHPKEFCMVWTRNHTDSEVISAQYQDYGIYLHEQCMHCGRATCWEYKGIAPEEFKETMPEWHRKKDSQRDKVYAWQCTWIPIMAKETLSLEECRQFANQIFREHNMKDPKVIVRQGDNFSTMQGTHTMRLAKGWGHCKYVIVHEAAHAVHQYLIETMKVGCKEPFHGPTFVTVYTLLAERYLGTEKQELISKARERKIKWADVDAIEAALLVLMYAATAPIAATQK